MKNGEGKRGPGPIPSRPECRRRKPEGWGCLINPPAPSSWLSPGLSLFTAYGPIKLAKEGMPGNDWVPGRKDGRLDEYEGGGFSNFREED